MKEGWTYKRLGDFCRIRTGKLDANAADEDGLYPFFTCSVTPLKINKYAYDCECVLVAGNGDLNVKYYSGKFNAYQRTYIIESNDKNVIDVRYLYMFLLEYVTILRKKSIGAIIKYIKLGYLTDAKIPLPSLSEQRSIVSRLDAAFAHIDALKANAEKQLAEARKLFQAELTECMRPKEGWEEKSFVNCIDKVPKQKQVKSKDYKSFGNYPIVSQEKELISGYWDDDSYLYKHERPIIIFGDHTKEIKYVDFNFVVGADGTQILSPKKGIDARFFYYALVATPLRTLGYARHFKLLKEKTFFIPPLDTQDQIVFRLDALSANIKKLEEVQRKTLAECDALKQAMLREVFE